MCRIVPRPVLWQIPLHALLSVNTLSDTAPLFQIPKSAQPAKKPNPSLAPLMAQSHDSLRRAPRFQVNVTDHDTSTVRSFSLLRASCPIPVDDNLDFVTNPILIELDYLHDPGLTSQIPGELFQLSPTDARRPGYLATSFFTANLTSGPS